MIFRKQIFYTFVLCSSVLSHHVHANPTDEDHNRPPAVQQKVDEVFQQFTDNPQKPEKLQAPSASMLNKPGAWCYNGDDEYYLMKVDDSKLLRSVFSQAIENGKTEVNILDIGAGNFSWGDTVVKLQQSYFEQMGFSPEDPPFFLKVVSLRGGTRIERGT